MTTAPKPAEVIDPALFDDAELLAIIEGHGSRSDIRAGMFTGSALWRNTRHRYAIVLFGTGLLVVVRRPGANSKWVEEYFTDVSSIVGVTMIRRAITFHRRGAQNRTYVVKAADETRAASMRDLLATPTGS